MGIDKANLEDVSWIDLEELVEGGVPEALRLEYKREPYGGSDDDKRELLKDVSALANSSGGHLIIGIAERDGCADALVGIDQSTVDAEIRRVESIVRTSVEPRIVGLRMHAVIAADGRAAIVIRVQRSWNGPHRVTFKGLNKFYVRISRSVNEAGVEELRTMFTQSSSALSQAREFRDQRLRAIASAIGMSPLQGSGRLIVHIVPISSFSQSRSVDLVQASKHQGAFRPMGVHGWNPRFNYEGFVNEAGRNVNIGYTQLFRNGCLECTKAGLVHDQGNTKVIPIVPLEGDFFDVFAGFIDGLRDLAVQPPFIVMVTLEGVLDARLMVGQSFSTDFGTALQLDRLTLPECIVEDFGEAAAYHLAIRPAFDALWNAKGSASDPFFGSDGTWVGPK